MRYVGRIDGVKVVRVEPFEGSTQFPDADAPHDLILEALVATDVNRRGLHKAKDRARLVQILRERGCDLFS
jgi:hypothetical protein